MERKNVVKITSIESCLFASMYVIVPIFAIMYVLISNVSFLLALSFTTCRLQFKGHVLLSRTFAVHC